MKREPTWSSAPSPIFNLQSAVFSDLLDPLQIPLECHRLLRIDQHVELGRLEPVRLDLDLVAAGVQRELLERAVELIDVAHEVAVDVDLRGARLDLQLQVALLAVAVGRRVSAAG